MTHWDTCPVCGGPAELMGSSEGTTHMRALDVTELAAALRRAHDQLDVGHDHTTETWQDRQRWRGERVDER